MAYYSDRPSSGGSRIKRDIRTPISPDSGLTVLPPDDGVSRQDSSPSVASSGKTRSTPRTNNQMYSHTPRRTPTPTKQVSLQAARRKEDTNDFDFQEDDIPIKSNRSKQYNQSRVPSYDQYSHSTNSSHSPNSSSYHTHSASRDSAAEEMLKKCYKTEDVSDLMEQMNFSDSQNDVNGALSSHLNGAQSDEVDGASPGRSEVKKDMGSSYNGGGDIENSDEFDTDLEDEENEEANEEERKNRKAPNDLLMEFLDCIMKQEWQTAQKLCTMILLFEPNHREAKEFQSTIEDKIRIEEELANMSSDDEDDDDDDDDDDDSDSDESDEGNDDSDNETDDDAQRQPSPDNDDTTSVADSGIASVW